MIEFSFIEQVMMAMVVLGLIIMICIKTPMRAMFATMALGAMLTVMILYQTMDASQATGAALIPVGLMIWPTASLVFFVSYVLGVFLRRLVRAIKPAGAPA